MNKVKWEIVNAALGPPEAVTPDRVLGRYLFTSDFIGFKGHFPEYPVLPAYVQVLTALTLMETWKNRSVRLISMEKAKFHIELRPEQEVTVECREYEVRGKAAVEARLSVAEGLAASMSMIFEEA